MIGLPFAGSGLVHGLFMGLGIVAGLALFAFEVRRRDLRDDRLWVIAGMCLALAAIASRMGTWWQQLDPTQNEPLLQWWSDGNRSVLAALVGAWIGVLLGKRMTGYKPSTGDLFAPSVALAMAIGRIGCLLTELPGHPTGGPGALSSLPNRRRSSVARQGSGCTRPSRTRSSSRPSPSSGCGATATDCPAPVTSSSPTSRPTPCSASAWSSSGPTNRCGSA